MYCDIIQGKQWKELCSKWKIEHPLCERCLKMGVKTPVAHVHHIKPIGSATSRAQAVALAFDKDNLVSLCISCHNQVHKDLGSHTAATIKQRKERQIEAALDLLFGPSEQEGRKERQTII